MGRRPAPGRLRDGGMAMEKPGRSDAKYSSCERLAWRSPRLQGMISVEPPVERMTQGWKCSQGVVSKELMVTE